MTKEKLQIHSENIFPIIKKWLYSDKDIFVRELVSNACDAIHKVKILRDQGELETIDTDFRVQIQIDKPGRTLKFIDNGIGMAADEVQKYIAQIAFSGAEEFMEKYKSNKESDQFIGHFGLGFYSAYMVANKVEIDTLSYKPGAQPVLWSCDGSPEYLLENGKRETRGTEITLHINQESEEFLEEHRLSEVLNHYCAFLPYPIFLGDKQINAQPPLWIKSPSECTQQDYLEFYRHLYPMDEEPLFWVHLNVDYPFHLKGILYFPKVRRDFDPSKYTVKLFCNRVFVSDNCKDVIPNYLMTLRGVIDSPDIPLNVSRSYLQMDRTVRQLGSHISKKVSDSLSNLYRNERERYIKSWEDLSVVIKLGILEDDKFYDRVKEILIWKNVNDQWMTIEEYLEQNREKTKDKILYTQSHKKNSHFLDLYKNRGVEILMTNETIDPYVIQFLERKISPATFQRADASLHEDIIDKDREKTILDESGRTEAATLAEFFKAKLANEHIQVEAKSLAADSLPGFVIMDENQRRFREYMQSLNSKEGLDQMLAMEKRTFVVNTNSPLIAAIKKMDAIDPQLSEEMVKETYELALLSQHEMSQGGIHEFIARSNRVLEKLANFITSKSSS
jgi:molecular chaperone HtpG